MIDVELELDNDLIEKILKIAESLNMTFNEFVNQALIKSISTTMTLSEFKELNNFSYTVVTTDDGKPLFQTIPC